MSLNIDGFELILNNPLVLIGIFIGGVIPFVISSITMTAVGDAAFEMIKEIRRQFREIDGLLEGNAQLDTRTLCRYCDHRGAEEDDHSGCRCGLCATAGWLRSWC